MLEVLKNLKTLILPIKTLKIDNVIFQLHYRFTVVGLLAFSVLVTCRQYIGDPIECTVPSSNIREEVVDQYCWVSSTISLPKAFHRKVGTEVIYPGVDRKLPNDEMVRHQYYQWVCFVLFLQGLMFYLPHYMWKMCESGRLSALSKDLGGPMCGEDLKTERLRALTFYFRNSLHHHTSYGLRYAVCECLNLINVVGQMFLTNVFLGGVFLDYGLQVLQFTQLDQLERSDPMIMAFPRVTKCAFYTFGSTGDAQLHDAICVLPINIINEKIYIILWFWFVFLSVISGFAVIYRVLVYASWYVRYRILRAQATSVSTDVIEDVCRNIAYGDWFLLYLLSKNVNSYVFRDVTDVVRKQLRYLSDDNPRTADPNEGKELV